MLYDHLKILHILSATCVLTSMSYSTYIWIQGRDMLRIIQSQTWLVVIPFSILQLLTGFTMINLKKEVMQELWVKGSILAFIVMVASWMGFVYLLTADARTKQKWLLATCGISLLCMLFFMANRI